MKKKLPGYYNLSNNDFKYLWENCTFVLDANVLLNLYRYSPDVRNKLIKILESLSDRIWLPFQAAYEYHKNRLEVINDQQIAYEEFGKTIDKFFNKLENECNSYKNHPYIDSESIFKKIKNMFNEIKKKLKNLDKQHPDYISKDPIIEKVSKLFKDKVSEQYSESDLDKKYKKGQKRYDKKIPPGFEDIKEKPGIEKYGDFILWSQIIDYSKINKKSVILITDDRKKDWWHKFKGKTLGPLPALINEFISKTNMNFYMYSSDIFMEKSKIYLKQKVTKKSIDEVRKVREIQETDEKRKKINKILNNFELENQKTAEILKNIKPIINKSLLKNILKETERRKKEIEPVLAEFTKQTLPIQETAIKAYRNAEQLYGKQLELALINLNKNYFI